MGLSPAQTQAAQTQGHLLIPACPGSGKTTVLKHRAEFLLRGDPTGRLAAVTFTKDAATSLASRIKAQFPEAGPRLIAGTFHSLCKGQIERARGRVQLLNEGMRMRMIADALSSTPAGRAGVTLDDLVEAINTWQGQVNPILPPPESDPKAAAFVRFEELKRRHNVMDFNDLLLVATRGMALTGESRIEPLDVQYMLVDEFQDTDRVQLEWVMAHVARGVHVTVVGDDDQSIYSWRGGMGYGGMLDFKSRTGATQVNLDRTYRCSIDVLRPAARLIIHNTARVDKQLATGNAARGEVRVRTFEARTDEVDAVIKAVIESGKPESWGILARTNALLEAVECAIGGQFPYQRAGGESFWDLKAPGLMLEVAKSFATGSMMGVEELAKACGVGNGALARINKAIAPEQPGALGRFLGLTPTALTTLLPPTERGFYAAFQPQVREWANMLRSGDNQDAKLAFNGIGFYIGKYAQIGKKRDAEAQAENKLRLQAAAKRLGGIQGSLSQRLQMVQRDSKAETGGARLMTLHASKGLEFDRVWVLGCEEGTLPSSKSDLEEERRLMYVGITRAKDDLTLSHTLEASPSRFLEEAGLLRGGVFSAHDALDS